MSMRREPPPGAGVGWRGFAPEAIRHSPALPGVLRFVGRCLPLLVGAAWIALWGRFLWSTYLTHGLFNWIGVDFGYFYGQAHAFWSEHRQGIYDRVTVDAYHDQLALFTRLPEGFPKGM